MIPLPELVLGTTVASGGCGVGGTAVGRLLVGVWVGVRVIVGIGASVGGGGIVGGMAVGGTAVGAMMIGVADGKNGICVGGWNGVKVAGGRGVGKLN